MPNPAPGLLPLPPYSPLPTPSTPGSSPASSNSPTLPGTCTLRPGLRLRRPALPLGRRAALPAALRTRRRLLPPLRHRPRRRGLHHGNLPHRQAQGRSSSTASTAPSASSWRSTTTCSAPSTPANRTRVASIRRLVRQRTACPRGGLALHARATGHRIFIRLDLSKGDEELPLGETLCRFRRFLIRAILGSSTLPKFQWGHVWNRRNDAVMLENVESIASAI